MSNIHFVPPWLARESLAGRSPYESLQDSYANLFPSDPAEPGDEDNGLAERIAHRKQLDDKINAALADDFWEDDCSDLCSEDGDEIDDAPPSNVKTLAALSAEGILDGLTIEEKVGMLGHLPASFDTYQDMVEYQLDHRMNDQFLDAKSDIQAATIWHHQIAYECGFDPALITENVHNAILALILSRKEKGDSELESIRCAYKAMSMVLTTLERLKCYPATLIGAGRLILCAEWAIENGPRALDELSMPSLGKLLLGKPRRLAISYEMLSQDALQHREDESLALRNNACIVVGENPFHVRILFEKSSLDQGNWVEYSRQMKAKDGPAVGQAQAKLLGELRLALTSRGKRIKPGETRASMEDPRNLLGVAGQTPREARTKVVHLRDRDVILIGVPNGKQICWFPQDLPHAERSGATVADCDELGVPFPGYGREMENADSVLDLLLVWLSKDGKPLILDADASSMISEALGALADSPFLRRGKSLLTVAILWDVLRDRNPVRGARRILEYARGERTPAEFFSPAWGKGNHVCLTDWFRYLDRRSKITSKAWYPEPGDLEFLQVDPH
jgi:hypothetical protein